MRRVFVALFCSAVLTSGCRRDQPAPETPPPVPQAPPSAAPGAPVAVPAAAAPQPAAQNPGLERVEDRLPSAPPNASKSSPVDVKLTEALHRYLEAHGKLPQDFSALVAAKMIPQMPAAPAGKRYAIDRPNLQVVLINQ